MLKVLIFCLFLTNTLKAKNETSIPTLVYKHPCKTYGKVIPYFLNLYAINLIYLEGKTTEIEEYISWYLRHLNFPDKWGLYCTIYDYQITEEGLVSTEDYDSADGYAGTFLILISLYYLQKPDKISTERLDMFMKLADLLITLKDKEDGLTIAKASIKTKFLIDNIEASLGLLLFSKLLKRLEHEKWEYVELHAKDLITRIKVYFIKEDKIFWAVEKERKFPVEDIFRYPDRTAYLAWLIFERKNFLLNLSLLYIPLSCEEKIFVNSLKRTIKELNKIEKF